MARIERLSSTANPLLKEIRRAVSRGDTVQDGLWIAEGFHLVEEAARSGLEIPFVLAAESVAVDRLPRLKKDSKILTMPDALFETIAATESSQGVMALVKPPAWKPQQLVGDRTLLVILDGVQDPGNAGAIVRAAEAFGATGLVLMKGSVSPWNPKVLRASAGSMFRLPFVAGVRVDDIRGVLPAEIWTAMPWAEGALSAARADLTLPVAIVIGSEAHGVSETFQAMARGVAIPTAGVESLNASIAAAILLYEARRQRSGA